MEDAVISDALSPSTADSLDSTSDASPLDGTHHIPRSNTLRAARSLEIMRSEWCPTSYSVQSRLPLEVRSPNIICALLILSQVVERIAFFIVRDVDLRSFALTCKDFACAVMWEGTSVWRMKFLARYDYPLIGQQLQFRDAFRIRELTLEKFPLFNGNFDKRARLAMGVLKDMVLGKHSSTADIPI